jgi:hypothetical protein
MFISVLLFSPRFTCQLRDGQGASLVTEFTLRHCLKPHHTNFCETFDMKNMERDVARSLTTHNMIIQNKSDACWVSSVTDQEHFKPVLPYQGSAQHC